MHATCVRAGGDVEVWMSIVHLDADNAEDAERERERERERGIYREKQSGREA